VPLYRRPLAPSHFVVFDAGGARLHLLQLLPALIMATPVDFEMRIVLRLGYGSAVDERFALHDKDDADLRHTGPLRRTTALRSLVNLFQEFFSSRLLERICFNPPYGSSSISVAFRPSHRRTARALLAL